MSKRKKTDMRPYPRSGHCIVSYNHLLISYGGYTNRYNMVYHEMWTFNIIKKEWKIIKIDKSIDYTCLSSSMIRIKDVVYIFGGTHFPFALEMSNSISAYCLTTDKWEVISQCDFSGRDSIPSPRYGSFIFYYDDSIYVYGGSLGASYSNEMFKFNINTRKWIKVYQSGEKPMPSYRINGVIFNNLYYYFGGSNIETDKFETIYVFDLRTHIWCKVKTSSTFDNFPDHRFGESMAFSSTHGYLCGGKSTEGYLDDIWEIDLKTLVWNQLNVAVSSPVYFHASTIVDDEKLVIFGGITSLEKRTNRIEVINIRPSKLYNISLISTYANHSKDIETVKNHLPPLLYNEMIH